MVASALGSSSLHPDSMGRVNLSKATDRFTEDLSPIAVPSHFFPVMANFRYSANPVTWLKGAHPVRFFLELSSFPCYAIRVVTDGHLRCWLMWWFIHEWISALKNFSPSRQKPRPSSSPVRAHGAR